MRKVALAILFLLVAGGADAKRHQPPAAPVMQHVPAPAPVTQRAPAPAAHEAEPTAIHGINCSTIRFWANIFSEEHLRAMGKARGIVLTPAEEAAARKCIHS